MRALRDVVRGTPGAWLTRAGRLAALVVLAGGCRAGWPFPASRTAPTLMFVHGLGGSPADWVGVANALGRDHRVVLEALPGHGHRAMADSPPLAAATASVLRDLRQLDAPVVLVGHSIGGIVAVRAALAEPTRVVGLVLVETALRPQLAPAEREGIRHAFATDFGHAVREVYAGFASDSSQSEDLGRQAGAVGTRTFAAWLEDALGADLAQRAGALRVPVLVVLSPRSWPPGEPWSVTAESLGYARVPGVTPVRIDSCGHFVMLDRPAQLEADIRAWLACAATAR